MIWGAIQLSSLKSGGFLAEFRLLWLGLEVWIGLTVGNDLRCTLWYIWPKRLSKNNRLRGSSSLDKNIGSWFKLVQVKILVELSSFTGNLWILMRVFSSIVILILCWGGQPYKFDAGEGLGFFFITLFLILLLPLVYFIESLLDQEFGLKIFSNFVRIYLNSCNWHT